MKRLLIAVLCGQLALPGAAWSQVAPPPAAAGGAARVNLALIDFEAPTLDPQRKRSLTELLANELRRSGRFQVLHKGAAPEEGKRRAEQAEGERALAESRELFRQGREKFYRSQLAEARELLGQARRGLINSLNLLTDNRELFEVHLLLGRIALVEKDSKTAREMFKKAIFLDPKTNLSTKDNPPAVLKIIGEVKQQQFALPQLMAEIESQPPGARLFANGKKVGVTPLKLRLPEGEYFLRLQKDGYKDWYSVVRLEKENARVERALVPLGGEERPTSGHYAVAGEGVALPQPRVDLLSEAAFALGADLVFLATASGAGGGMIQAQLYDLRTQELSPVETVPLGASAAEERQASEILARKLAALLNADGYLSKPVRAPGAVATGPTVNTQLPPKVQEQWQDRSKVFDVPVKTERPWYKKWWIWALVAGVGAGGYFGVKKAIGSNQGKVIVDNSGGGGQPNYP